MYTGSGRRYERSEICISFFLFVILYFISCISPVHARDVSYLEEVLAQARRQRLHEDPYWHILVHYKKKAFQFESLVDDPRFFLAPDGKTDPQAELEATIRAFFDPDNDESDPVACRFVARYEWIRQRLDLDPERFGTTGCPSFMDFLDRIDPQSATLVFPMAHLNSPASMFGHTLLTVETADKTKLLAYSISYSAVAHETFGPLFAFKGLFGLYPGYFAVMPYYAKLQQYSDVDHRDIWEYPLNLREDEIRKMMLHIRELNSIASDYYFFSENCSYLLFFLLEAARPDLRLTDQFHAWLIPLDSIRMIEEQGLVTDAVYRPSRTTKIKYLASHLPEDAQDKALALSHGDPFSDTDIPEMEKMMTLELAGEYLQYLYTSGDVPQKTYQQRFLNILQARSTLGSAPDETMYEIPAPLRPDKGHRSNRLAIGAGLDGDDAFSEIRIRPAYHHLMDNDNGYVEGAQLIFADVALRYYPSDNKVSLESLDVIDIVSLTPRDKFLRPVSWKVKTGLTRLTGYDDEDHLVYQINPGGGFAFRNDILGMMYVMMETDLALSGALKGNYAAGIGCSAGMIKCPADFWKIHVFAKTLYYGFEDHFNAFEATVQQNLSIDADRSISFDVSRNRTHNFYETQVKVLWNLFF